MKIKGTTKITGVFGYPVSHSLSPVFQNAAFNSLSLDFVYIPFEVKPAFIKEAIEAIRFLNFRGINLTIPHKKDGYYLVDELDEEAKHLKVVNTIKNEDGKLIGYITDGSGFVRSIKEDGKVVLKNKNVYLLGAGGAGWAISGAIVKEGIRKLLITNRTMEKAIAIRNHLKENFNFINVELIDFENRNGINFQDIDIIINTTSLGMEEGDIVLIKEERIKKSIFIYDIIYNRKTELIKTAEKLNLPHLDGLSMLVYQGAISFEIWTGKKAPINIMKNSLYNFLKEKKE
ncbi:shikimate dehydrogenase [bacterium]|nr:shikimate dehydrogenase [bacterium]